MKRESWRRSLRWRSTLPLLALCWLSPSALTAEITAAPAEQALAPWSPGTLDIHHLSTGRGNATLAILPDGTTLLIDAGDVGEAVPEAPAVPNGSLRPGQWIARYLHHFLGEKARIDTALITHFHADHMGFASAGSPLSAKGGYKLSGITDVAEEIPVRRLIDRGWPDYGYPKAQQGEAFDNYRAFLAWQQEHGMRVERARPGSSDQLTLENEPEKYPDFEIRVVAANGEVWQGGEDGKSSSRFPPLAGLAAEDLPSENMCSIALRIRYGAFSYLTSGDLPGVPDDGYPAWNDVEGPIAKAIGRTNVVLVGHHGSISPASPGLLAATQPRVVIVPTWAPSHPAPVVVKRLLNRRIYPGERDVFTTRLLACTRQVIGPRADKLESGHILVRVDPGDASYRAYVLDETSLTYAVRSVHGPYSAATTTE